MPAERLQKILARAGIASRRAAETYITQGRVRVNGQVVTERGAKADPLSDTIEVEGHGVVAKEPLVYVALHKPIHVVTTLSDPERRQTVIDVLQLSRAEGKRQFEGEMPRVFPIGRLDFDAEGILLLTNDGDLANALMHPRYHVPKTYVVKVKGRPDERALERMRRGLRLKEPDGSWSRPTAPAEVLVLKQSPANTWLEITIVEGRHHQVKRMCEAVGHFIIRLIRTEIGGIELGNLPPGAWRFLTNAEVDMLRGWTSGALRRRPRETTRSLPMAVRGGGAQREERPARKARPERPAAARPGRRPAKPGARREEQKGAGRKPAPAGQARDASRGRSMSKKTGSRGRPAAARPIRPRGTR